MNAARVLFPMIFTAMVASWPEAFAQNPPTMSLAQAEVIAIRNHPRIASANLTAQASAAAVKETAAAKYPSLSANLTAVGAEHGSTVTAGSIVTSSLYSRASTGVAISQLVTDFGRTSNLEQSAHFRASAQDQSAVATRAQVLLEVRQAYFDTLARQAVLKATQAALDLRRVVLRQITALAKGALRSTVDVSFAEVNVSEAELDQFRAEDAAKASHTALSAALGYTDDQPFDLTDEPMPPALESNPNGLIATALEQRPDLASSRAAREAAIRFAEAEKRLKYPTVSVGGVAGAAPTRDERLRESYSAAGVNISVPILNGGLFAARRSEAQLRADAAGKQTEDLAIQVARDVQIAWLNANDAFRRLDVTARLVTQSAEALRLAQARYNIGLGSVVELDQAQVAQTSAQIASASAKYEYLMRCAELDYAIGALR